jgi:hypothetical protein
MPATAKDVRLTDGQLAVLRILAAEPGLELTVGEVMAKADGKVKWVSGRLRNLKRRGFLTDRWGTTKHHGHGHFYRLGPMSDALKDRGILT